MTRHRIPHLLSLLALPLGLLAGCGGGSIGSSASTTTTAATAAKTTSAKAPAATVTAPASASPAQRAAVSAAVAAVDADRNTPLKHRFAAAPISNGQASRLAKRGSIAIPVVAGGPGRITAFGQAEIPGKGIVHVAEAVPRTLARAGVVQLTFNLLPVARAQLAAGRSIMMYVAVGFSKGEAFERIPVRLSP